VDVKALTDERCYFTDGEVVWSWRPKVRRQVGDDAQRIVACDGGKRDGSPRRVRISRKATARGRPECIRLYLWSTRARATFLRVGRRVQRAPGLPCALGFSRVIIWQSSDECRRENA
jgi:hypothetical protein